MANIVTSVREYCQLLSRSKLLPADDVEAIYRKWREGTNTSDDQVEQFRRYLVSKRYLTEYQAVMLYRGHADGFFLDGYKILDRIGKGQMAGVYRAVHTLGQTVALKILPSSKAKNPAVLGRFEREARLLTLLDHPNVIRAFQLGESNGVHYIVMEYVEGETLDDVLERRKRLPVPEAVRLVHQALNGLQHLHEKRVIHRDLKPANLMLTPPPSQHPNDSTLDSTVRIVDIGLGRELFDENVPEGQIDTQLTVEGAVLGTPDYLAPEQARDARAADIRSDIYSLGCVLYHCLMGSPPFPDTNIMAQMVKHATEKPKPIATLLPDAPKGLQAVLDQMLAKHPAERFATPADAAAALKPFLKTPGAKPSGPEMVPAYREWLESTASLTPAPASNDVPASPARSPKSPSAATSKTGRFAPITPPAGLTVKPSSPPTPASTGPTRPPAIPSQPTFPPTQPPYPASPGYAAPSHPSPGLSQPSPAVPSTNPQPYGGPLSPGTPGYYPPGYPHPVMPGYSPQTHGYPVPATPGYSLPTGYPGTAPAAGGQPYTAANPYSGQAAYPGSMPNPTSVPTTGAMPVSAAPYTAQTIAQPDAEEMSAVDVEVVNTAVPAVTAPPDAGSYPAPNLQSSQYPEAPGMDAAFSMGGRPKRPLTEFTRRDFIMLGSGGLTVITAVFVGFGLARLLRRGRTAPPPPETKPQ